MILSCHNIRKSFGENHILKEGSFGIEDHQKCALVGINGAGKSTLLKIIAGELPPDEGQVILTKGKTIGYLAQEKMVSLQHSIYEEVREARRDLLDTIEKLSQTEAAMKHARGDDLVGLMNTWNNLRSFYEQENGYALESEITGVLKGLGFAEEEFSKITSTLSGGEKTRVALARLLLSSPDILLLDEPTNHLDIGSITWLENYLLSYPGTVFIVSHDRYFLNRVVSKVVEIDQGIIRSYEGNYTAYAQKKEQIRQAALKAYLNQQQMIAHQEEVIRKLKSFNREKSIKRAESREKMLEKQERLEKPTQANDRMVLSLNPLIESGKDVLAVEGLAKAYGREVLFQDLSFMIRRGERVALIGSNGTGKTTILKIINGLEKADEGTVSLGAHVHIGYYDQEHQVLHSEKALFDEISDAYPDLDNTRIRNVLASFLFMGDDVFKRVGDLSGGERGRLALAKLMLSEANFLILDEPTNHLDIASREILESALLSYTGTLLYVSHDRYFINNTATRILHLDEKKLTQYLGDYDYYLEKSQALQEEKNQQFSWAKPQTEEPSEGRLSWTARKEEQAAARKRANDLKKTEEAINTLEEEDKEIDYLLSQEKIFQDMEQCLQLTNRKAEIARELEDLYLLWEELA
ncbi:MAG: ABC-F family ATP-binding cassette domain-containing protein [Lachnospiraceae bacterium]|nr:ABC-F family ATP-binding cassette domain-containing protein [Lachnospiraceae bacterium]